MTAFSDTPPGATGLQGRVAIATGAAGGIGAAAATRLACEGARFVVAELDGARADADAARIVGLGGGRPARR